MESVGDAAQYRDACRHVCALDHADVADAQSSPLGYALELRSTERTYMTSVSWLHPEDQLIALRREYRESLAAAPIAAGVRLYGLPRQALPVAGRSWPADP
jgi:hypothetical protein